MIQVTDLVPEFHPALNNVIRFHNVISKKVLCAMLHSSQKRLFVDSSLQHAAAAMNLPSTVVWVATQHKIFGYGLHDNIEPQSQNLKGTVDSYLYDYSFNGVTHECPYNDVNKIHKIDDISPHFSIVFNYFYSLVVLVI